MEVMMEINRDVYLNRLIVRKHNGFIKVITGIRRSGKSYLLNTLFYNHLVTEHIAEDHIIKFAFDSAEDLIKIVENPLVLDNEKEERKVDPSKFINWLLPQVSGMGMYYLLLDEVQKLGAFESVLNLPVIFGGKLPPKIMPENKKCSNNCSQLLLQKSLFPAGIEPTTSA